jgi:hypothetical protein
MNNIVDNDITFSTPMTVSELLPGSRLPSNKPTNDDAQVD